jgi:hypothetical protein
VVYEFFPQVVPFKRIFFETFLIAFNPSASIASPQGIEFGDFQLGEFGGQSCLQLVHHDW